MKKYLITSALPYASGITHLGNIVGSTLPADIYARYCRLRGRDTLSICGSDEHGVAITIAAEKSGITPREIIDRYHTANAEGLRKAGIEFDWYGRTSSQIHRETAQEFFKDWLDKGLLVEREADQFYDAEASMFLPDRYVEGICPNCGYDKARGDQCDNCGAYYNQLDLKIPRSLVSGKTPVVRKTKHWYFKLNEFQEFTEKYIEAHATVWKDNVLQQSRSWLKQGLAERTATRDMSWGIPVPIDSAIGKVIYVWFEAVLGYISITKEWAAAEGKPESWKDWWQNANTSYTAFLGKDNIVFHTIIFPILLHSRQDQGYILPENIPANEFLNLEGQKFSKSRNWGIDILEYQKQFPQSEHVDILRYVLTMNMPETKDSDFTWKDYQARTNNELSAILGNYVNRVMQFVKTRFEGVLPSIVGIAQTEHEQQLHSAIANGVQLVAKHYDDFRFRDAATETMNIARAANKYFNDKAPWKSIKDNPQDCALTMHTCLDVIQRLAIAVAPILPHTAEKMQIMLGSTVSNGAPKQNALENDIWMSITRPLSEFSGKVGEPELLFTKVEDTTVLDQVQALAEAAAKAQPPVAQEAETPVSNTITIDDVKKVELRTAIVLEAERVPKSSKLLKLQVDLGTEKRQILAGIGQHYTPEELIGKTIVVVANLATAKLMGQESQGMVLAASNAEGVLSLISPNNLVIGAGAEVR